jgi:uncharacterized membrane protein
MTKKHIDNLSKTLLGTAYQDLGQSEQHVINSIVERESITENINEVFFEQLTFGQRLADKISTFGGSWTFIIIFFIVLVSWMLVNSAFLIIQSGPFDPYPYILLNLVLSSLAAL